MDAPVCVAVDPARGRLARLALQGSLPAGERLDGARVCGAQQFGDNFAGMLAASGGDSLEALGIVTLDANQDSQLRVGISLVDLKLPGVGARDLRIEIARLRVGICPRILVHLNQ